MILIVTYDLRTARDYHEFYEALKAQAENGKWWHYMASTWIISTSKTPQAVVSELRQDKYLDPADLIFVCELAPNYQGWLPKPAWDWINSELQPVSYLTGSLSGLMSPAAPPPEASLYGTLLGKPDEKTTADTINSILGLGRKK